MYLLAALLFFITFLYGVVAGILNGGFSRSWGKFLETTAIVTGILSVCSFISYVISWKKIAEYFETINNEYTYNNSQSDEYNEQFNSLTQINTNMETTNIHQSKPLQMNKTLIKGVITGILILVMLIPTFFISNLTTERHERKEKIMKEASNKWASAQTLSGPYLFIPYNDGGLADKHLIILPEHLDVRSSITPEERQRSIYKILFYKSNLTGEGDFLFSIPADITPTSLKFKDAKICFALSDFKGIENKIAIVFNNSSYELSPGLPTSEIDTAGLSAPVQLTAEDANKSIRFSYKVKIKGSGQLHFMPLSGNSTFALASLWNKPSFDGNTIPNENKIDDSGFTAKWVFNKANLPFTTVLKDSHTIKTNLAFGVSMLLPVDDYDKTARCIKYAILFIGLTFSLFFIVEIMQKKPFHPVQYVLVGLALVIFYTLLLSLSEFIFFDYGYLIASMATALLISLYAQGHFKSWRIASLFAVVLSGLYAFNYVLISLEDTALLVGSIALFIVLAIVMYASRKINWYGTSAEETSI